MKHSAGYRRWCDGLHPILYECFGVRGVSQLVMAYAREFLGQELATIPQATVLVGSSVVKLSDDRVATVRDNFTISVWSVLHDQIPLTLEGHTGTVFEINSLDSVIVSSSRDCSARVWDGDSGECLYELIHPTWVLDALVVSLEEWATCCSDDHIRVWRCGECVAMVNINAYTLMLLSNGQFASCTFEDVMHVWSLSATGSLDGTVVDSDEIMVMQMTPFSNERRSMFATHDSTRIYVWNEEGEFVWGIENDTSELCALDRGLLAAGSPNGTVRVWNIHTGRHVWTLTGHTSIVWCLALMPNGMLASGSMDCTVRVWDLTTGQCAHVLSGLTTCVKHLCASTHNLTAIGIDCTMCMWE